MKSDKLIYLDIIAGARPNFIKIAPLLHELKKDEKFKVRLIHTGQHYDSNMSDVFFSQLHIPKPEFNLAVGSGSQAEQTGYIMMKYEDLLQNTYTPDLCVVVGDVNSTMACSIVAKKHNAKVAHIEAGLRSGDLTMPEEINRILTDSISDYFFTTSKNATQNLLNQGVNPDNIFFVGNIMIDTLKKFEPKFCPPEIWEKEHLLSKCYLVLTLHRPSNVVDNDRFLDILKHIDNNSGNTKIIYPVHPRVSEKIKMLNTDLSNIITTNPLPYLEFNFLLKHAKGVITDSGGITEEATVYNVPCLTLRNSTERPETVITGSNELIKDFPIGYAEALLKINNDAWKKAKMPEKWDGKTAVRILECLIEITS